MIKTPGHLRYRATEERRSARSFDRYGKQKWARLARKRAAQYSIEAKEIEEEISRAVEGYNP